LVASGTSPTVMRRRPDDVPRVPGKLPEKDGEPEFLADQPLSPVRDRLDPEPVAAGPVVSTPLRMVTVKKLVFSPGEFQFDPQSERSNVPPGVTRATSRRS